MNVRTRLALALITCALIPVIGAGLLVERALSSRIDAVRIEQPSTDAGEHGDAQIRSIHTDLGRLFGLAAVLAVCVAVFLALVLTPALARPLRDVADAAEQMARGTRSVRIGKTGRGEAGKLVTAFNRMARELDAAETRLRRVERIAAWRDIARQMAHEIKNPLTPIQMAVEMLRKARERSLPDFDALFDEQTRIVLEEVSRIGRLVEDFSRFARAPKPRLAMVSVTDVVTHVVQLQAAAGGAEVTGEADAKLPEIRADREQLTQVLMNVVQNASQAAEDRARAAPAKGPAAVHVTASNLRDGRVRIAVDDNGGGIDAAVLERLFEPYVTTRHGKGGTGLGLAIAFRIVTDHGGTITADTSPEGTRFEVVLPVSGPGPKDATLDSDETRLPT